MRLILCCVVLCCAVIGFRNGEFRYRWIFISQRRLSTLGWLNRNYSSAKRIQMCRKAVERFSARCRWFIAFVPVAIFFFWYIFIDLLFHVMICFDFGWWFSLVEIWRPGSRISRRNPQTHFQPCPGREHPKMRQESVAKHSWMTCECDIQIAREREREEISWRWWWKNGWNCLFSFTGKWFD